jgi:hypothetical protein
MNHLQTSRKEADAPCVISGFYRGANEIFLFLGQAAQEELDCLALEDGNRYFVSKRR